MKKTNDLDSIQDSLDVLKTKLAAKETSTDLNGDEKKALSEVYGVLTKHYEGRSRVLDISCGSCINIAMRQARNHVVIAARQANRKAKALNVIEMPASQPPIPEPLNETPAKKVKPKAVKSDTPIMDEEYRNKLEAEYEILFERKAPHNMKTENIEKKIADAKA
jgi:hypothetical protein